MIEFIWAYNAQVAVRPFLSSSTKEALHGTNLPYFVRAESGLAASILQLPLAPYHIARKAEVVYLPSPVVGQLGLGISKCSVLSTLL